MCKLIEKKFKEPRLTQKQICNQLGFSNSTFKRYGSDINTPSPFRIRPTITIKRSKKVSDTNIDSNSPREHEQKRARKNSKYLKRTEKTSSDPDYKTVKSKNKLNGEGNMEINDNFSDEFLHNSNL